jgi:hypothetical protein
LPYFIVHSSLFSLDLFYPLFSFSAFSLFFLLFSSYFFSFFRTDKRKENFLMYKKIQKGTGAKSSFFYQSGFSDSFYLSSSPLSYFPTLSCPQYSTL